MPVGEAFRARFRNPYAVSHRADLHGAIHEAVRQHPLIRFHTSAQVEQLDIGEPRRDGRHARRPPLRGRRHRRLRRRQVGGAQPGSSAMRRASRATWSTAPWCRRPTCPRTCAGTRPWSGPAPTATWCTTRCATASNTTWSSPSTAATTRSGASPTAARKKCCRTSRASHARPRQLLDRPTSWRRWSTADRDPVANWSQGPATLLGDAAHPMMQYLAQGACMALEDAVTLGAAVEACDFDLPAAFQRSTRRRASRAPRASCSRCARWAGSITRRASSGWCATPVDRPHARALLRCGRMALCVEPEHCLDDARLQPRVLEPSAHHPETIPP